METASETQVERFVCTLFNQLAGAVVFGEDRLRVRQELRKRGLEALWAIAAEVSRMV